MKLNKIFIFATVAAASLFAVSCNDDNNDSEYSGPGQWDAQADFAQLYFQETSKTESIDPVAPTTYTFEVFRRVEHEYTYEKDSEGNDSLVSDVIATALPALTAKPTLIANTDSVFTVSDVTFAEGDTVATVTLSFPNTEIGKQYTAQVKFDDPALTSIYSADITYTYKVTRVKWNDVGYIIDAQGNKVEGWCSYTDDLFTALYNVDNLTFPARIQERGDLPGYFRLINVYGENYPYNDPGDWDESQDYYMYIDATNPNKVELVGEYDLGVNWGNPGNFYALSFITYYTQRGATSNITDDLYGKYENGIITFPARSLLFSYYGTNSLYYGNTNGAFRIVLDPTKDIYTATIEDYDWTPLYSGIFSSGKLGTKKGNVRLYKGVAKAELEAEQPGCYERDSLANGIPYYIENPYEEGSTLVFYAQGEKIIVPDGYELQETGISAVGDEVFAKINAGKSAFVSEEEIVLNITFTDADGEMEYGTAEETLINFIPTEDNVFGTFTLSYVSAYDGETYDGGVTTIVPDEEVENGLIMKDLLDEGSEFGGVYDLSDLRVTIEPYDVIGTDVYQGSTIYLVLYSQAYADYLDFDINFDGTLTTTDLGIVAYNEDLSQALGWWEKASIATLTQTSKAAKSRKATSFVPVTKKIKAPKVDVRNLKMLRH